MLRNKGCLSNTKTVRIVRDDSSNTNTVTNSVKTIVNCNPYIVCS